MHSPFVFQFILNVLNNKQGYTMPDEIEDLRKELLLRRETLLIEDFGAGSRISKTQERTISELAKSAIKPKKYGQLLYRLVKYYAPPSIIELGTSLGTTTAYLAAAAPKADIITIEGSAAIQEVAAGNFKKLGLQNIESLVGNFDQVLPQELAKKQKVDLVYIDGNHRYEPTLNYFKQLLPKIHNNSILIFDDIHWSAEMEQAWTEIRQHPAVRCTVDTFFLGFVFFREEFKVEQHFTIRY
ncbi:MAG: class SAM-dependent methyltransferase [Flaviaesturariibacter sp.]|nr:class SAM-dependent methyltransferase [Flaviaesturariibacter sp.]